jgi:trimeric autotransporter adhesin
MKTIAPSILIILSLVCVARPLTAQAVSPPPDGGYPGGNTAEGSSALLSCTTGIYNSAIGIYSLLSVTTGSFNTGIGAGTLLANTADENTATGAGALLSNTTGVENTANGAFALFSNTEGSFNTAIGEGALLSNTTGTQNTVNGTAALGFNSTGNYNDAVGAFALFNNISGSGNNAFGNSALLENMIGVDNTAVGDLALLNNDSDGAGTANFNTAVGSGALAANVDGGENTALGVNTLANNKADFLTAVGVDALFANTTGSGNTAIGSGALAFNTTGGGNTALGLDAGSNVTTANNVICIGAPGNDVENSCFIGNIFGATSSNGLAVLINSNGRLGTMTSSARFKDEIKPMGNASEALFALKPVTFRYKKVIDPQGIPQLGLVAEEVEAVNPALVVRDKEGKPYSVRYDQVNAMLLNEFLKEHRKVEEHQAAITQLKQDFHSRIAHQQKQIEALTAGLQKVSAQLELNKSAPQTVVNNQ